MFTSLLAINSEQGYGLLHMNQHTLWRQRRAKLRKRSFVFSLCGPCRVCYHTFSPNTPPVRSPHGCWDTAAWPVGHRETTLLSAGSIIYQNTTGLGRSPNHSPLFPTQYPICPQTTNLLSLPSVLYLLTYLLLPLWVLPYFHSLCACPSVCHVQHACSSVPLVAALVTLSVCELPVPCSASQPLTTCARRLSAALPSLPHTLYVCLARLPRPHRRPATLAALPPPLPPRPFLPSPDAPSHPLCLPLCRTCEGSRRYEPFVVGMQLPPGEGAALIGVHLLKFQLEFAGFLCVGGKSEQVSK